MDKNELIASIIIFLIIIALVIGGIWWSAGQEAKAFERQTGKVVSQWDAMFLELRVDCK